MQSPQQENLNEEFPPGPAPNPDEPVLPSLRFSIPVQAEESLRVKLRKFGQKRCVEQYRAFSDCSKSKTFTGPWACKELNLALVDCLNSYVNEPNLNKLRHAYVNGDLMKQRTYEEWSDELKKRKAEAHAHDGDDAAAASGSTSSSTENKQ